MKLLNQNEMDKRAKQREVFMELVNLQLSPHNKTYDDVVGDPEWYMRYKTTRANETVFISEGIEIIRKKLKLSKKLAEREMSWFILQWGLTTNEKFNAKPIPKTARKVSKNQK
jgi:hypothetical protein